MKDKEDIGTKKFCLAFWQKIVTKICFIQMQAYKMGKQVSHNLSMSL
jgi:hypothetical protein